MRRFFSLSAIAAILFVGIGMQAETRQPQTWPQETRLKKFLQNYLETPSANSRYLSAFVHLNDTADTQVIVYLLDESYCGSGGCNTLILKPEGASYRVLTSLTITRPPIHVLTSKSNGWHDIAVQVGGGGILHAYEAKLSFDGKTYPHNPTVSPAKRLSNKPDGKTVIFSNAKPTPLF
jgi:hypothetical protein